MPVEFEGQLPETPYIFRIRLTCDHCRERLEVELPVDYPEAEDAHSRLMNEALRYVGRHGWQWDSPGESAYQVVTCHECRGRQQQLRQALGELPSSTFTSQQLTQTIQLQNSLIAHSNNEDDRFRQEVEHMLQEAWHERPSAGRWADVFRQEVMGQFPDPPDVQRVIGVDPAVSEDESVVQVLIDGKATGQTVRLRRDHTKIEPLRKSKWERLMEDDDETCP